MRKCIAGLLAIVMALMSLGVSAQSPVDVEARAYASRSGSTIILAVRADMVRDSSAQDFVDGMTVREIESAFEVEVTKDDTYSRREVEEIGVDRLSLFAFEDEDGGPGLMAIVAKDEFVFFMIMQGEELDGALLWELTYFAVHRDMDLPTPDGFFEVPFDGDDLLTDSL